MTMGKSWTWGALLLVGLVGCGAFGASDDDTDDEPPGGTKADGGLVDALAGDAGPDAPSGEAGADAGPPCELNQFTIEATADTCLGPCGAINYGNTAYCHVGGPSELSAIEASGIYRFKIGADDLAKLGAGRPQGAVLELVADPNCSGCGGGLPTQEGTIAAHVARSDWEEGDDSSYSGANICRRTSGGIGISKGWGADRPSSDQKGAETRPAAGPDYDAFANEATVDTGALSVAIEIASRPDDPIARRALETGTISFYVTMPNGRMIVAHRENPGKAPKLTIKYCAK